MRTAAKVLAQVAAATLAAAAWAVAPVAPAQAATCASADGVTVVVDFHELGGGAPAVCVGDGGGRKASDLFPAAGFRLDYVQRQPGFVCQVSGKPADNPCINTPPADAYWGLWWSDGKSGAWSYATTGASGLTVPDGGYVAFSWNGSPSRATPGVSPRPHPSATPTPTPTQQPTTGPTKQPTKPAGGSAGTGSTSQAPSVSGSGSADATASAGTGPKGSTSAKPGKGKSRSGSAEPSETASEAADPSADPSSDPGETADVVPASSDPADPDGGLPTWVAPVVIVLLFGAAGTVVLVRRRTGAA
ncbi:MAG: hypothetical protein WBP61_14980 [Nocardioides sp.]